MRAALLRPVQEGHDQAQLRKAIFAGVMLCIEPDAIEIGGEITVILKLQPRVQIDGTLQIDPLVQIKELPGLDRLVVDNVRYRAHGQIDGGAGFAKVDEPVSAVDLEQPVAKLLVQAPAHLAAIRQIERLLFPLLRRDVLLTIMRKRVGDLAQILRALAPVEFCHLLEDLREHRMQARIVPHQVAARAHKDSEIVVGGKIAPQCKPAKDQPKHKDIGKLIVMARPLLPGDVAGIIGPARLKFAGVGDGFVGDLHAEAIPALAILSGYVEAGSVFAVCGAQSRFVDLRLSGKAVLEPEMPHGYAERVHAIQRGDKSLFMQRRNLFDQRQRRSKHILRPNAVGFTPLGEKIAQFPGVFWRAVLKHGWISHWAAPRA